MALVRQPKTAGFRPITRYEYIQCRDKAAPYPPVGEAHGRPQGGKTVIFPSLEIATKNQKFWKAESQQQNSD